MSGKWHQRDEYHRITPDWVHTNCKNITQREMKLLKIVRERKLVRRDHLEVIHSGYRNIKTRTNSIDRSITKLFRLHCLDKTHEKQEFMKGNKPSYVALDRAGFIVLGSKIVRRVIKQKVSWHGDKLVITKRELPQHLDHINGINQLEVDLINNCDDCGLDVIRWKVEKEVSFTSNGKKVSMKPDVFCILKSNNAVFVSYFEYDTGTEDNRMRNKFPIIEEKLTRYRDYKQSGAWKNEDWYKKLKTNDDFFPMIVFATEDKKRIGHIVELGKKLGLNMRVVLASEFGELMKQLLTSR